MVFEVIVEKFYHQQSGVVLLLYINQQGK